MDLSFLSDSSIQHQFNEKFIVRLKTFFAVFFLEFFIRRLEKKHGELEHNINKNWLEY